MKFLLDIGIINCTALSRTAGSALVYYCRVKVKLKREGKDEVPRTGYEVLEAGRYF